MNCMSYKSCSRAGERAWCSLKTETPNSRGLNGTPALASTAAKNLVLSPGKNSNQLMPWLQCGTQLDPGLSPAWTGSQCLPRSSSHSLENYSRCSHRKWGRAERVLSWSRPTWLHETKYLNPAKGQGRTFKRLPLFRCKGNYRFVRADQSKT